MAVAPESLPAIDRTQPLPLIPESVERIVEIEDAITAEENHTVYVSFDATGVDPGTKSAPIEALLEAQTSATALGSIEPAAAAAPSTDPAELVQIQALELAANRAEIARHMREQEDLQRALRLRDGWLADVRKELKMTQEERRVLAAQLAEARRNIEEMSKQIAQQAEHIAALEAQAAERMSMTAFAGESSPRTRPARSSEPLNVANPATLMSLDDSSPPIVLDRKVMTVGRTRETDICVPSVLVSRDHARLLVSEDSVVLFDVGSINGSFVNEQPVKRQTLKDGDVVRFADRRYRFCG